MLSGKRGITTGGHVAPVTLGYPESDHQARGVAVPSGRQDQSGFLRAP